MRVDQVDKLRPGIYRLHWTDGGSSLASVGLLDNGLQWFAPASWTSKRTDGIASTRWDLVTNAELLIDPRDEDSLSQ